MVGVGGQTLVFNGGPLAGWWWWNRIPGALAASGAVGGFLFRLAAHLRSHGSFWNSPDPVWAWARIGWPWAQQTVRSRVQFICISPRREDFFFNAA